MRGVGHLLRDRGKACTASEHGLGQGCDEQRRSRRRGGGGGGRGGGGIW